MDARVVARRQQQRQAAIARATAGHVADLWARLDPAAIDRSWAASLPRATAMVTAAQQLAAAQAAGYLDEVLAAQGVASVPVEIDPAAFAGVASDGRGLVSLLDQPRITALTLIQSGAQVAQALAAGGAHLDTIVRTQVADAGRTAVGAGITATKDVGYIRVVSAGACSRCIVLAGRFYRWNSGFLRHPGCHCSNAPAHEAHAKGLVTSPRSLFDKLSTKGQDRIFTRAGAQAIRDGADIGQVVNARRGMSTASIGGRDVKVTRSGVGRRGKPRLMPEEIYRIAGDDRDEAIRLLRQHGYLRGEPGAAKPTITAPRTVPRARPVAPDTAIPVHAVVRAGAVSEPSTWTVERLEGLAKADKQAAAALTTYLRRPFQVNKRLRMPGEPLHELSFEEMLKRVPFDTVAEAKAVEKADRQIAALDRLMGQSHATGDMVVYRGASAADIGLPAGDATGFEWTDRGFVSTSGKRDVAEHSFAGEGRVLLTITAPDGTPAIFIGGLGEAEVLLGRGQTFRVVADHGVGRHGIRRLDVEIVPERVSVAATLAPATARSLADHIASGEASRVGLGGGESANTYLVTFNDGAKAVRKTGRTTGVISPEDAANAEELSALFAARVGIDAPEVVRAGPDTVYMAFVDDATTGVEKFTLPGGVPDEAGLFALADTPAGRRLGLFDVAIGNYDRNGGNYLFTADGRLVAIDHGLTWADADPSPLAMALLTQRNDFVFRMLSLSESGQASGTRAFTFSDVNHLREALRGMEAEFTRLGRHDWYIQALKRLDVLDRYAGFGESVF